MSKQPRMLQRKSNAHAISIMNFSFSHVLYSFFFSLYSAVGYLTGRPGCCLVVPGPGFSTLNNCTVLHYLVH